MTDIALFASILLSIGSMYWGYSHEGFAVVSRWDLILGIMWLYSMWQRWSWVSSFMLFSFVLLSAFGLFMGIEFGWMLAGSVFALFAWDMTDFRRRLTFSAVDDDMRGMERRHLARLSLLTLAGLFFVSLAMFVQLKFTFEWVVFLVVVVMLGLTQLIGWLRRQGK